MNNFPRRIYQQIKNRIENRRINRIIENQWIAGKYKRIYQYHIRKTGGTSVNMAFFDLAGDRQEINKATINADRHRHIAGDKIFVRWNPKLISGGMYFYAVSHFPYYELNLPEDTFTFAILRDPVARIISQYKNSLQLIEEGRDNPAAHFVDRQYMDTLDDFVRHLPRDILLNQIALFTPDYDDVDSAEAIIRSLTYYFCLENFDEGMRRLSEMLDLPLQPSHVRKSKPKQEVVIHDMDYIKEMMSPEIELYNRLIKQDDD